jgi:hypothetical protein
MLCASTRPCTLMRVAHEALVFGNPAMFGLPRVRGIFLRMLCASTRPCTLVRVAHEALVFGNPAMFGLPRARGIFLRMLCASTRPCTLVRVAHEALVLSRCLRHTLDFSRRFFISRCTSRGTKHHGHVEVINNGPSPLIRAQSLRVFRACCFLGEGPIIDTVPSPLPCGVQPKINGLHAILISCRSRGAIMRFNLISVLKSSLS